MGNYDKHFWGSRERRKKISGSREHELKTFLGTRGFINGEQGIKSKKIKGSWEHVPPPGRGSEVDCKEAEQKLLELFFKLGHDKLTLILLAHLFWKFQSTFKL